MFSGKVFIKERRLLLGYICLLSGFSLFLGLHEFPFFMKSLQKLIDNLSRVRRGLIALSVFALLKRLTLFNVADFLHQKVDEQMLVALLGKGEYLPQFFQCENCGNLLTSIRLMHILKIEEERIAGILRKDIGDIRASEFFVSQKP